MLIAILALSLVGAQSAKRLSVSEDSDLAPLFVVLLAFLVAALPGLTLEALIAAYRMFATISGEDLETDSMRMYSFFSDWGIVADSRDEH